MGTKNTKRQCEPTKLDSEKLGKKNFLAREIAPLDKTMTKKKNGSGENSPGTDLCEKERPASETKSPPQDYGGRAIDQGKSKSIRALPIKLQIPANWRAKTGPQDPGAPLCPGRSENKK